MDSKAARWINILLGAWLFLSAFFWPHSATQYTNTWIMGIITVVLAIIAIGAPAFRYLKTLAAVWLIISAFVLPTLSLATRWNNFFVGIVIGALSLVGSTAGTAAIGSRPRTV
jgi:predicted ferric reductase